MKNKEIWFVVGSQHLYGPQVLKTVEQRAKEMAGFINKYKNMPVNFVFKTIVVSNEACLQTMKEANYDDNCLGIVTWCHTFSPSKMWINGLKLLQKPWCHLATQYHKEIPNLDIDMDFMNLNQAAHGDREHGFIGARLRKPRKIIAGYYKEKSVLDELSNWARAAIGFAESQNLNVLRFGDNMRNVAVTEGDKVEAQIKFGWQVNTWASKELVEEISKVSKKEIDNLVAQYKKEFNFGKANIENIRYQAAQEIAIKKMLDRNNCKAYTNTFEDLCGMKCLPGLASQHLMARGYGYGGEGDWKVSAMTRIIKKMTEGLVGGTSFMEDYSYNLANNKQWSLGAHMLEVCPSLAANKPTIITNPLGIGKNPMDPARLVFENKPGKAICASLIDMGGRFRLIVQDIETIKPPLKMPNLPVARVTWIPMPNLLDGLKAWIMAGGAHHTVLSFAANAQMLKDWADMVGIEFVHIHKDTCLNCLEANLRLFDRK